MAEPRSIKVKRVIEVTEAVDTPPTVQSIVPRAQTPLATTDPAKQLSLREIALLTTVLAVMAATAYALI